MQPTPWPVTNALAHGRDPLLRVRATRRAIELRLATQQLTPAQAADAYDKLIAAWHGGNIERAIRERLAGLLAQSGKWQQSLTELRTLENDYPEQAEAIRSRRKAAFTAFLSSRVAGTLSPLDFLALVRENADVEPEGDAGIALQMALADKLIALDLSGQAASVLQKLLASAASVSPRAEVGARLARLLIREGDASGALEALDKSNSPNISSSLTERRSLIRSRALALQGNAEQAVALLAGMNAPAADQLRAEILERKHDWPGAEQALKDLAGHIVPTSGPLTDAQRNTLLHLATAMTHAGDDSGLADLRSREMERMGGGPMADLFHILTEPPIHHLADLPNAEGDLRRAAALPGELNSVH
jgi:predicted negative regulator of RcsB-dependent stress response